MNLAILKGRLGADPEISYTQSAKQKAMLRLATSKRWTDQASGEKKEATQWHRVIVWDRLAEIAGQYLAKGKEVLVTGEIQTRQYQDKEGRQAYITEIVAKELELIGARDAGQAGQAPGAAGAITQADTHAHAGGQYQAHHQAHHPVHQPSQAPAPAYAGGGYAQPAGGVPFDDDIPF